MSPGATMMGCLKINVSVAVCAEGTCDVGRACDSLMCETWTLTRLKDHVATDGGEWSSSSLQTAGRRREGSPQMSGAADVAPAGVWPPARLACGKHTWDEAASEAGGPSWLEGGEMAGWAVWAG